MSAETRKKMSDTQKRIGNHPPRIVGKHNWTMPESVKKYRQAWYQKNKAKVRDNVKKNRAIRMAKGTDWSQINKDKIREYNYQHKLKISYGLTIEGYNLLLGVQNGRCAICSDLPGKRRLAVDHDHKTGIVRSLLCGRCNTALGNLRENPEIMLKMIAYINKFKDNGLSL